MINCTDFLRNDLFYCEHLTISEKTKREINNSFSIQRDNARGLEEYIKIRSFIDEQSGLARTFLVRDCETNEIACYFTLKAGQVSGNETKTEYGRSFDSISGIELSDFAVNHTYSENHPEVEHVGAIVFSSFIYKLALQVSKCIGVYFLYIFALPEESLINYYKSLNFIMPPEEDRINIIQLFTPRYDKNCVFMCQKIVDNI